MELMAAYNPKAISIDSKDGGQVRLAKLQTPDLFAMLEKNRK